jgi:hypothetical protein
MSILGHRLLQEVRQAHARATSCVNNTHWNPKAKICNTRKHLCSPAAVLDRILGTLLNGYLIDSTYVLLSLVISWRSIWSLGSLAICKSCLGGRFGFISCCLGSFGYGLAAPCND